ESLAGLACKPAQFKDYARPVFLGFKRYGHHRCLFRISPWLAPSKHQPLIGRHFFIHATGYYAFAGVIIDHGVSVMPAHSNIYFHLFSWGAGIARMPPISNRIRVSPGMPYLLGSGIQAAGDSKGFGHISRNHGVSPSRG